MRSAVAFVARFALEPYSSLRIVGREESVKHAISFGPLESLRVSLNDGWIVIVARVDRVADLALSCFVDSAELQRR